LTIYTVNTAKHATLVANVVDTVNINVGKANGFVRLINRGANAIYCTIAVDGGPAISDPTVSGDDTTIIPNSNEIDLQFPPFVITQIRLISAGAVAYSVEVIDK